MLETNNHSYFSLRYHLVLITKQRRKIIDEENATMLKQMFVRLGENHKVTLRSWTWQPDHLCIGFSAHPKTVLTTFVTAYKAASSRNMKRDFPEVQQKLSGEALWSNSFCLLTTDERTAELIQQFLSNGMTSR